jgi:signal transduction histidine kinase
MTRRIAMAILRTCCMVLLTGGLLSYLFIRQALLEELDASLVVRASSLPEVLGVADAGKPERTVVPAGDRYIIRNSLGQTVARPGTRTATTRPIDIRARQFVALADGTRMRSVTVAFPGSGPGGDVTVMYSGSAERYDQLISRLGLIFVSVGLAAGLLTAFVALVVARTALRPVTAVANTIASINEPTLDRRLDVELLPEELRPMAVRLNQMLTRLEAGLLERKQFMADAAHELRTPVAALLTTMEVALRRPRDTQALTQVLAECVGDVQTLRRLVETLLEQFRTAPTSSADTSSIQVNISQTLDLCMEIAASHARGKNVRIRRTYAGNLHACTHPRRFRSIVSNLVDNAVEYNNPGGEVEVCCETSEEGLVLVVRDTGPGISSELLPNVFQPFFRGHHDSAVEGGHCGLGLFLVKSHVDALGGTCVVRSTPGRGTEFCVKLPAKNSLSGRTSEPGAAVDAGASSEVSHPVSR